MSNGWEWKHVAQDGSTVRVRKNDDGSAVFQTDRPGERAVSATIPQSDVAALVATLNQTEQESQ